MLDKTVEELIAEEYEHKRRIAFAPEVLKRKKKKQSPANQLTDDIIKFIKLEGGAARRVNSQGQFDEATGRWRFSGMKRGFEDIDATMAFRHKGVLIGIKVGIEIKIKHDEMSEYQEKRRDELLRSGAFYMVAKSFDNFSHQWIEMRMEITRRLK